MDALDAIKNRRSIRRFKPDLPPKEKIDAILEAAAWAPSAGNIQARAFILVSDQKTREKLAEAAYGQDFISEAPVAIVPYEGAPFWGMSPTGTPTVVVCADHARSSRHYGTRGSSLYAIQDATAAVQNILIASHALGLGSCWLGAFSEPDVRRLLAIPNSITPVAIVPLGIPDEKPRAPKRKNEVHSEKW